MKNTEDKFENEKVLLGFCVCLLLIIAPSLSSEGVHWLVFVSIELVGLTACTIWFFNLHKRIKKFKNKLV
jgi:hypothetical protein